MIDPDVLSQALDIVLSWQTIAWMTIGVMVGIGFGAMPGLQASTAVALMLPFSFSLPLGPALGLLIGLYKGAIYGGSISAISFSTPGTPEAAATVFDGYKLMRAGKGRKALLMALYASVTADFLSDLLTIMLAPMLAVVALQFGSSEKAWLMLLAITLVGALTGRHLAKGLLSAMLGLFLATIGSDPIGAVPRNTFDLWWLSSGISIAPMVIGLFAMSMVFYEILKPEVLSSVKDQTKGIATALIRQSEGLKFVEYIKAWKEMLIGLCVGSFVGMLPGLGATVGAFLSYAVAKQVSPHKGIGQGALEGVAAAEAGNNATVGPTLIPLLVFGIPGSTTTALIGGALMMQGATPSPRMFELYPHVVYALFGILLLANIANLGLGRIFAFAYAKLGELPRHYLVPLIGFMSIVGTYYVGQNPYDVVIMLVFGVVGLVFRLARIPEAPLVITFILGPLIETYIRRSYLIGGRDWTAAFFDSWLSIGLCLALVLTLVIAVRLQLSERIAAMRKAVIDEGGE